MCVCVCVCVSVCVCVCVRACVRACVRTMLYARNEISPESKSGTDSTHRRGKRPFLIILLNRGLPACIHIKNKFKKITSAR